MDQPCWSPLCLVHKIFACVTLQLEVHINCFGHPLQRRNINIFCSHCSMHLHGFLVAMQRKQNVVRKPGFIGNNIVQCHLSATPGWWPYAQQYCKTHGRSFNYGAMAQFILYHSIVYMYLITPSALLL